MFGRHTVTFIGAGILATLVACHQAKPATSPYEAQQTSTESAAQDRTAREAPGFVAQPKQPAPQPASYRWPAPAPEPTQGSPDDPLRVLEIP